MFQKNKKSFLIRAIFVFFLLALSLIANLRAYASNSTTALNPTETAGAGFATGPLRSSLVQQPLVKSSIQASPAKITKELSDVWAGYTVIAPSHDFWFISGSWIVPSVTCNSSNPYSQGAFFLAWLDGYSSEGYIAGFIVWCAQGSTAPEYLYVDSTGNYSSSIAAGDVVFAVAQTDGTNVYMSLTDLTTGTTYSDEITPYPAPTQTDGSVIIDRAGGCSTSTHLCPLVNFGTVDQGYAYTGVHSTCGSSTANTANGIAGRAYQCGSASEKVKPIGAFGHTYTLYQWTMTNFAGTQNDAKTSGFATGSDSSSWTTTFKHAGP